MFNTIMSKDIFPFVSHCLFTVWYRGRSEKQSVNNDSIVYLCLFIAVTEANLSLES